MSVQFNCQNTIQLPFSSNEFKERKESGSYCKLQGSTLTEGSYSYGTQNGIWVKSCIDGKLQRWKYYQQRTGAICWDGSRSYATGRGACSHHGGVKEWTYGNFKQAIGQQEIQIGEQLRRKKKQISELLGLEEEEEISEQELLCKILSKSILFIKGYNILNKKIDKQNQELKSLSQQNEQLKNENMQLSTDIQAINEEKVNYYEQKQLAKTKLVKAEEQKLQNLDIYRQKEEKFNQNILELKSEKDEILKRLEQIEQQYKEEQKSIEELKEEKTLLYETIFGIESLMKKNLPNRQNQYESFVSHCQKSSNQSTLVSKFISNGSSQKVEESSLPLLKDSQQKGDDSENQQDEQLSLKQEITKVQEALQQKKQQKKQKQQQYSYFNTSYQEEDERNEEN